ncbi:MAG: hypothetical protein JRN26_04745 [Nitrososphaerota archaeon]|jgi:hypothetical protein|nr:hypothetical protein [Nitrososphaerota archaeon]MDG6927833.1 hypothetical protein [Nitrososphaerota archaeon]MDG6931261.1 hypothetical protein [Nitrososphaerota archaeon]MDG6932128.1 hypothetical protein [Nitrososphaerota archaeon]MDG6936173.1 hypothetical protein [Nitrososphaerota archaeon]
MSINIESVYGFERIISEITEGHFEKSFSSSSALAGAVGLADPYIAFTRYDLIRHQFSHGVSIGISLHNLAKLGTKPAFMYDDVQVMLSNEKLNMHLDLFEFLYEAARKIEEAYGISVVQLMTGQVIQPVLVSLSGVTTIPEGESPYIFKSTMMYIISILTGKAHDEAKKLYKIAIGVELYDTLAHKGYTWKRAYYANKYLMYLAQFNEVETTARSILGPAIKELESYSGERTVRYFFPPMKQYYPFYIVDRNAWQSGNPQASGTIALYRPDFPHTAVANQALLGAIYSSTGSGKTTLLNSLTYYSLVHGNFVVRLDIDVRDSMQPQLMALPLDKRHPAYPTLKSQGIDSTGIGADNVISVMVVEQKSDLDQIVWKPTKLDRLLYVEDARAFHFPWERIAAPRKLFAMRYVDDRSTARAYRTMVESLRMWRIKDRTIPLFVGLDEAYQAASSMASWSNARAFGMASESSTKLMMNARGLGIALFLATQRPKMITGGVRTQVSHIFAADVGEQKDMEVILDRIPRGSKDRQAVEALFEQSQIRADPYHWFIWLNLMNGQINVIRSVFPPTGSEMPAMTPWDQFHEAKLSLDDWHAVPTLFNDIGTESNPLPLYEAFLPEKELKEKEKKKKFIIPRPDDIDDQDNGPNTKVADETTKKDSKYKPINV